MLIGLPFVALVLGSNSVGLAWEYWGRLPLGLSTLDSETQLALGPDILTLILLAPFYWRVKGRDRPLLALLWKYALASTVIWIVWLLAVEPHWPPESWPRLPAIVVPTLVIFLGVMVAFGRAASRQGFRIAVLFILATEYLGHLSFTHEYWYRVDSVFTGFYLSILMLWSTWLYGAVLTLAAVWAVRRADSGSVIGWNVVAIPLVALLLFWVTELAVLSALDVWQLRLDSFSDFVLLGKARWMGFGVALAGILITVGLVYLVRVRDPDAPSTVPA